MKVPVPYHVPAGQCRVHQYARMAERGLTPMQRRLSAMRNLRVRTGRDRGGRGRRYVVIYKASERAPAYPAFRMRVLTHHLLRKEDTE